LSTAVDLDHDSRLALELDDVLAWVATEARTAAGAERVRALAPTADAAALAAAREELGEAMRRRDREGALLPASLPDVRRALATLGIGGTRLDPLALREIAAIAAAGAGVAAGLAALDASEFPRLVAAGRLLPDLRAEAGPILSGIDSEGRILDEASPELARIRDAARRTAERIRSLLESMLRDPGLESVLQDDFITQRNGRFVVPVRTDAPKPLDGIVHARSSTGATRFVEPMASVELNNDLVRLGEEEREEEQRILAVWSNALRVRLPELDELVLRLTELDVLDAKASFGRTSGGCLPRVEPGGPLVLAGVRHPLLDRHLAETGGTCVPLDLTIDPPDRVLVLSGPNTGGKTVALKTIGLTVLMAQSGLPVPGREVRVPLYARVRADIGDRQSIEADLSTYSAHVRSIVDYLAAAGPGTLLLFDEIGTGTEPAEGAALAQAILESLLGRGITAAATTHLGAVKAWAFATPGATCAAMEFDRSTLRPTYRIHLGAAGVSAGLDIAERLGMQAAIVARARARLGPDAQRGEEYLRRLRELIEDADRRGRELDERRDELERERRAEQERIARESERRKKEAEQALDRALAELRKLARREIDDAVERAERSQLERNVGRAFGRVAREAARVRRELAGERDERADWVPLDRPETGAPVWVRSLGKEGVVRNVRGERVEVQLGQMTVHVAREDLRVPPSGGLEPRPSRPPAPTRSRSVSAGSGPRELVLVGRTVDEARADLERFLDAALVAGHERVRIVHGRGTGRLRAAVRAFLAEQPHVRSHREAEADEGGDAATVVELA
jgi:DNA mismatch repair protein MutS2